MIGSVKDRVGFITEFSCKNTRCREAKNQHHDHNNRRRLFKDLFPPICIIIYKRRLQRRISFYQKGSLRFAEQILLFILFQPFLQTHKSVPIKGSCIFRHQTVRFKVIPFPESAERIHEHPADILESLPPAIGNVALTDIVGLSFFRCLDSSVFADHLCNDFFGQYTAPFFFSRFQLPDRLYAILGITVFIDIIYVAYRKETD